MVSKSRPLRRWGAPLVSCVAVSLLLTACVSGGGNDDNNNNTGAKDSSKKEKDNDEPIATSQTTVTKHGSKLEIGVLSLEREKGKAMVLTLSLNNRGNEPLRWNGTLGGVRGKRGIADGVNLIDTKNMKRYYPSVKSGTKKCVCSDIDGASALEPNNTVEVSVAFPTPPKGVKHMTVTTPAAPDFIDIPVTQKKNLENDILGADIEHTPVLDISSFQDDVDGDTSREETGDETSIMLSSDVLFDTNKSNIKSKAQDTLKQVAKEIEESSDDTIKIDGYTDNTGNDSINDPLSKNRAKAVKNELKDLVANDEIDYKTKGHGSSDPVGDNNTEKGRTKNRRVTVTFEK